MGILNEDEKRLIVKSNSLIEGNSKLTLSEQRLINLACKKLKPIFVNKNMSINDFKLLAETMAFEPIEITVGEYKNEFSINSNNIYKELSKTAESLFQKEIIYFDDEENLVKKRWVITSKYSTKERKIGIKFHPDLITDLLVFKGGYTQLDYVFMNSVKSIYTSRFYEILKQYLNIGIRTLDLSDLRFKLGVLDNEYPRYVNFKQRILSPSINWINENSDIYVDFEEMREKRSVKRIKFIIKSKAKDLIPILSSHTQISMEEYQELTTVYEKIRSILNIELTANEVESICNSAISGMNDKNIKDTKPLDYIAEKWEIAKKYTDKKKDGNYIGSLISALKGNWTIDKKSNEPKLKFNNFKGRNYDWEALEEMALGHSEYDNTKLYKK